MPLRRRPNMEMRQKWRIAAAILFVVAAITSLRSSRPHDASYMLANQDVKLAAAITDDLRELAVLKAKQTPGWGNRNENERNDFDVRGSTASTYLRVVHVDLHPGVDTDPS